MSPPPFRIPIPVFEPVPVEDNGFESLASSTIHARQNQDTDKDDGGDNSHSVRIVVFVLAAVLGTLLLAFLARHLWQKWSKSGHTYQPAEPHEEYSPTTRQLNRQNQADLEDSLAEAQANNSSYDTRHDSSTAETLGVDRNTSVRSVMTLPVYRPKAAETERVLGREGERDGIDVVVEMTTAEQEEALRDEEMESMYQIRAARRRQMAEREERRRLRREARDANNVVALRELREQSRATSAQNTTEIEELRQEHDRIRETRQRAVSSVSYADVGIARADGTRIRANSTESTERVGLLSDAASIAATDNLSLFSPQSQGGRNRSASATLSIDTARTLGRPVSPNPSTYSGRWTPHSQTHSRSPSGATTPRAMTPSPLAGSSPEMIDAPDEGDLSSTSNNGLGLGIGIGIGDANGRIPPPPEYEEISLSGEDGNGNGHASASVTPLHSRPTSPWPDPPPDYPGPTVGRVSGREGEGRIEGVDNVEWRGGRRSSAGGERSAGGESSGGGDMGRLPDLRLSQVPQIVIEPSSARP